MSRRGSVKQEANSTWRFTVDVAPLGAPRNQVKRRGFRTKRDAQDALTRLLADVQEGSFVEADKITVAAYLADWLDGLERRGLRPTTIRSYRSNVDAHVRPAI